MVRSLHAGELSNIQALRALAAIGVMSAHIGSQLPPELQRWPQEGTKGVDLFFVISGFIMVHITRDRWVGAGRFLLARALRIYPLWLICLFYFTNILSSLTHQAMTGAPLDWYAIKSALLIPALDPDGAVYPAGLIIGWTLSYELFFYLVFAVVMQASGPKHLTLKLAIALSAMLALSSVLPAGAFQKFLGNSVYLEFLIGVFIGELYTRNRLGAAFGALLAVVLVIPYLPLAWYPYTSLRCVDFGLSMGVIVAAALLLERWSLRAPKPVVFLGDGSYSIYLVHLLTFGFFINLFAATKAASPLGFALFVGVGMLAACMLAYVLIERPIQLATRYLLQRISPQRTAVPKELSTVQQP
jgi:exopolysaccharide production protein ExoZ